MMVEQIYNVVVTDSKYILKKPSGREKFFETNVK